MRNPKVRAWDTQTHTWVEGIELVIHTSGRSLHIPEHIILTWSTGLVDVYGKEIYEGDIVKWEYEDAVGWHKIKRLVTWVAEDAYFDIPVKRRWTRNIKVIGNMYENPELVEVRN